MEVSNRMYFSPETDKAIDWDKVDKTALAMLEKARSIAAMPFVITSNYRTPEHSVEVGGIKDDAHTRTPCAAFDVAYSNTFEVYKIVTAALAAGFQRIGINAKNKHVHLDNETSLPLPRIWIE